MRFLSFLIVFLFLFVVGGARAVMAKEDRVLPSEVRINGVRFIHIPAGWFWHVVGTGDRNYTPAEQRWFRDVRVWLDGYYIARSEARATDFLRFMNSGKAAHAKDYGDAERDGCTVRRRDVADGGGYFLVHPQLDLPADHLSWNLADEFSRWMGFRLPRETEWVKAARGTDKRAFPWGDEYPDDTFGGFGMMSGIGLMSSCLLMPEEEFLNGQSPYGVLDMATGVSEYVADWENHEHDAQLTDGDRNPTLADRGTLEPGYSGPMKILKGGRWIGSTSTLLVHYREVESPQYGLNRLGVRFAVDEDVVLKHLKAGTAVVGP